LAACIFEESLHILGSIYQSVLGFCEVRQAIVLDIVQCQCAGLHW